MEKPSHYHKVANKAIWEEVKVEEIEPIEKNVTWTLVKSPTRHKPIGL